MMSTLSNSLYAALKREGVHNWGFLNLKSLKIPEHIDVETLSGTAEQLLLELEE